MCLKITRKFSPVMSLAACETKKKKGSNVCLNVRNKRQTNERGEPAVSLNEAAAEFRAEREKRVTRAKNLWLDETRGCPDAAAGFAAWNANAQFPWGKRVLIPK